MPAPGRSPALRLAALVRLVHPFPSLLDGGATTAIALVAGADPWVALRLGGSMVGLQVSIGALNDVLDAPSDGDRKPGKPIPAGLVSATTGRAVVILGATVGLLLGIPFGPGLVGLGGVVLAIGYAYDLRAKGTAWSWLPFALGIPLLPVYAWFGATGGLPASLAVLLPAGVAAGSALAIANALADVERDRAAGLRSVAQQLGAERAWAAQAVLLVAVVAVAVASAWLGGAAVAFVGLAVGAGTIIAIGLALGHGRGASPVRRERAWEIEATGVALLAVAWLAAIASGR
jgi:4-hydroxybenzoate polyprenyltransferase